MWKEEQRGKLYRFQTDDPLVNKRMNQRKNFYLIGWSVNTRLWIFQVQLHTQQNALRTLKALTGNNVIYNKKEEIYSA